MLIEKPVEPVPEDERKRRAMLKAEEIRSVLGPATSPRQPMGALAFGFIAHRTIRGGKKLSAEMSNALKRAAESVWRTGLEFSLRDAVLRDDLDAARQLLRQGVKPHAPVASAGNSAGLWTPLHTACLRGNVAMAKLLADAIRDAASGQLDARESKTGRSPAMVAADAGHWDLVRTLVKAGANPNQMDFGDASYHEPTRSLSHRAASTGSASLMRQLHAHGADLSLRDGHGIPVLFHAVAGNAPDKREMIDDIVRCGGDIHGKYGKNGETALMMAARIGDARTVEHLLVTHRVDPNALSDRGMSAVMVAAIADKAEVIEVLHRHGAMLEAQNGIGFRAAHFAASNNSAKALAMLGKLGADLAAHTSTSHDTPLSLAKTMESKECLSILDAPAQASRRAAQLLTMLGAHGTPDSRSRPPGP